MLTFKIVNGKVAEVIAPSTVDAGRDVWNMSEPGAMYLNRNDFVSLGAAEVIAQQATELTGDVYLAVDRPSMWPRFDVVRAPKVGDEVSYTFNGDYYPDGTIVKVSASRRVVTTSTGHTYYHCKNTGSWVQQGGTWYLCLGHISRLNPSY